MNAEMKRDADKWRAFEELRRLSYELGEDDLDAAALAEGADQ